MEVPVGIWLVACNRVQWRNAGTCSGGSVNIPEIVPGVVDRWRPSRSSPRKLGETLAFVVERSTCTWTNDPAASVGAYDPGAVQVRQLPQFVLPGLGSVPLRILACTMAGGGASKVQLTWRNSEVAPSGTAPDRYVPFCRFGKGSTRRPRGLPRPTRSCCPRRYGS